MTTRHVYNIIFEDKERESLAEGLADALFRLQGDYPSALMRLCRTLVDIKGPMFVEAVTHELDEEHEAMEEGNRP